MRKKDRKPSDSLVPDALKLKPKRSYLSMMSLRRSLSRLQMFRYIDTYGGRAVGGERLEVTFKYQGVEELIAILTKLEIEVINHDQEPVKRVPDDSVIQETKLVKPTIIRNTQWIENPGHTEIFGETVFVWCDIDTVIISLKTAPAGIDRKYIKRALALEERMQSLSSLVTDPTMVLAERLKKARQTKK